LAAFASASGSLVAAVCGVCNPVGRSRACLASCGTGTLYRQNEGTRCVNSPCIRPVVIIGLTGAIADPQPQPARSGTPEEQAACSRDVQRHCRPVIDQGDFTILACLQQNRPS